jgi:hypothetical protein
MDLGFYSVDPEVRRNTLAALDVFKSLGCTVEEVKLGWNWGVNNAWMTYWSVLFAGLLGDKLPRWRYEITEPYYALLRRGRGLHRDRRRGESLKSETAWRSEVNSNCRYRFVNSQTTASG